MSGAGAGDFLAVVARPRRMCDQAAFDFATGCGSLIAVARTDHASRARHFPVPLHRCESVYGVSVMPENSTAGG